MRNRASGGWNCHAFHANSEFYADYGNYDVTFTVPSKFVVGATGKRVSETPKDGKTTYRYVQNDVHDFAWTADPRTLVTEFTFDPARDIPEGWSKQAADELGMTEAEIALKPVSVRLLLQPGHEKARERYIQSDEGRDLLLRPLVRRVPLRDADRRRPAGRRRRLGRHGVPDVHHGPRAQRVSALAPGPGAHRRERHDPRVRPRVLVRHGRLERVRGVLARRGPQHGLGVPHDGAARTGPATSSTSRAASAWTGSRSRTASTPA